MICLSGDNEAAAALSFAVLNCISKYMWRLPQCDASGEFSEKKLYMYREAYDRLFSYSPMEL